MNHDYYKYLISLMESNDVKLEDCMAAGGGGTGAVQGTPDMKIRTTPFKSILGRKIKKGATLG